MNKVVISACYGGFGLSKKACMWLYERLEGELKDQIDNDGRCFEYSLESILPRHHPLMVEMVETLGSEEASGSCAKLKVVEIPGDVYRVTEYDGYESLQFPDSLIWTYIK